MLLVPVNDYALHQKEHHISCADGMGVRPTALYSSSIGGAMVNPLLAVTYQCVAIPAPSYILQDAISHPYQQTSRPSSQARQTSNSGPGSTQSDSSHIFQKPKLDRGDLKQTHETSSILLSLLNQPSERYNAAASLSCSREITASNSQTTSKAATTRLRIGLRSPFGISETASKVMEKIATFVQNLDSFKRLPPNDQELLFMTSWAKLFALGMAQEKMLFDVVQYEVQDHSEECLCHGMLSRSLLSEKEAMKADEAVKLRGFVQRCMELQLTPIEYAYFMGTVLFDHDVPGLQEKELIRALQAEALNALAEYQGDIRDSPSSFQAERDQQMRLTQILLGLPTLKSTKTQVIADLFFNDHFEP